MELVKVSLFTKHDFTEKEKNRYYKLCALNDHPHIDEMWDDFWKCHAYDRKTYQAESAYFAD